jgi:protein SCO1/2
LIGFGLIYLRQRPAEPQSTPMQVSFGGPFTLVDSKGRPFTSSKLAGRPYAMFFGFTHCPDVCPTTLARLVKLRRQLGDDQAFQIVFVTVDPERDGPTEVGRYTDLFGAPVVGLTGSPAQIAQVKKEFGIFSEKVGTGDDYTVDHTASVLLFDRGGQFQSTISPDETDPAAFAKLKRLTT